MAVSPYQDVTDGLLVNRKRRIRVQRDPRGDLPALEYLDPEEPCCQPKDVAGRRPLLCHKPPVDTLAGSPAQEELRAFDEPPSASTTDFFNISR
ncbi:hypothetical protein MTO96_027291 [Rhipicephalus appendiculatus]